MLFLAALYAVGCLLNCIFYLIARLVGAQHIADRRALTSVWWMIGAWSWFILAKVFF
ncbi:MAG: hypothetical protein RJR37_00890 [Peptococcaceae bacterium MAG4]|nr:hypothetical protein [Peptococcaceae bacterium MAG4]